MSTPRDPNDKAPVLPPEKARQGRWGFNVLTVLVVSLLLAMAVWWGVEIYGGAIEPTSEEQVGDPQTVQPPESGAPTTTTMPPSATTPPGTPPPEGNR